MKERNFSTWQSCAVGNDQHLLQTLQILVDVIGRFCGSHSKDLT